MGTSKQPATLPATRSVTSDLFRALDALLFPAAIAHAVYPVGGRIVLKSSVYSDQKVIRVYVSSLCLYVAQQTT